ncbi:MAG: hypothetical protein V1862_11830 [Methanobacteriota archaeon]
MSYLSRIILILFTFFSLVAVSGAYIITIDAPDSVTIGSPLVITGSTSFPVDTYFDLVLFYSKYTAGEVKRQKVIIDKSKEFRTDFETRNLEKGQYKVEVHAITSDGKEFVESSLGSASVTRRIVQLVDRSNELIIESEPLQNLTTALIVSGRVKGLSNGVVTLRAFGPDNFTFGPLQLITKPGFADTDGHFSTLIPISIAGEYQVSISDKDGFISESSFNVSDDNVAQEKPIVITPMPTTTKFPSPPVTQDIPATPSPTEAKSPLPGSIATVGIFLGYCVYKKFK